MSASHLSSPSAQLPTHGYPTQQILVELHKIRLGPDMPVLGCDDTARETRLIGSPCLFPSRQRLIVPPTTAQHLSVAYRLNWIFGPTRGMLRRDHVTARMHQAVR